MPAPGPPISEFSVRGSYAFSSVKLLLQLTHKNNFEKNKKSTGQEGGSSV